MHTIQVHVVCLMPRQRSTWIFIRHSYSRGWRIFSNVSNYFVDGDLLTPLLSFDIILVDIFRTYVCVLNIELQYFVGISIKKCNELDRFEKKTRKISTQNFCTVLYLCINILFNLPMDKK